MNVTSTVSNLTSIPTRRHSDLQVLNNNDHPWYSAEPNRIVRTSFTQGLDASKSATPAAGAVYYATDTTKLYECFATNVWTQVSDICIPASPATGDIIYYDGAKWNRLASGALNQVILGQGASTAPIWGSLPALNLVASATAPGGTATFTVSSIPSYRFLKVIFDFASRPASDVWNISFNADSGTNYAYSTSTNLGAFTNFTSQSIIQLLPSIGYTESMVVECNIANEAATGKCITGFASVGRNIVSSLPDYFLTKANWDNTSSQITSITVTSTTPNNYSAGDRILVFGY